MNSSSKVSKQLSRWPAASSITRRSSTARETPASWNETGSRRHLFLVPQFGFGTHCDESPFCTTRETEFGKREFSIGAQKRVWNEWESFTERPDMRAAVLTGGGDCPGLNAVIRAVV